MPEPNDVGPDPNRELGLRLIHRAGYEMRDVPNPKGGEYDDEFRGILHALHYIGARKVDDYGDFRLQDIRSWPREIWGAYWDLQRKFGRLERQLDLIWLRTKDDEISAPSVDDLMETLADQAVYCVRMIQILRRLEENGMVPR
jgi:hypothetical protein